jgi:phospho-N-acetylmuramoyl-pentapeptide-transferase
VLYHLLYQYFDINIFKYVTFRGFSALLTSFFLSLIIAPYLIQKLKKFQNKEGGYVREYTPQTHEVKKYTPTMGGVLILIVVLLSSILWCKLDNFYFWVVIFTFLSFGILGLIDDYIKIKNKKGLSTKTKFLLQILFAFIPSILLYMYPKFNTILYFPVFKDLYFDLGVFFVLWAIFIIVASSNAVNLTDGLDGLAIGPALIVIFTFVFLSYVSGNIELSNYLHLPYIAGSEEISVFLMALLGAGLGFLWFNSFPAEMFMGDAGSLSIGAVLGLISIITKQEFIFAFVGAIFVIETVSVIMQVIYFKSTGGKRLFLRAPIHHHYELKGMPEPKIVVRVWIFTIILAIISLALIKIR